MVQSNKNGAEDIQHLTKMPNKKENIRETKKQKRHSKHSNGEELGRSRILNGSQKVDLHGGGVGTPN